MPAESGRARWVEPVRRIDKPWGHEEVFALVEGRYCGKATHVVRLEDRYGREGTSAP